MIYFMQQVVHIYYLLIPPKVFGTNSLRRWSIMSGLLLHSWLQWFCFLILLHSVCFSWKHSCWQS